MTDENEYKPTTEVVEGRYVSGHGKYTRKSFRRWLAARDAAVREAQVAKDARIAGDYTWNPDAHPNHGVVIAALIRAQPGAVGDAK